MTQSFVEIKSRLEKFEFLSYFSTKAIKGTFKINVTRYSLRIAAINDALVCLASCKAYENKQYPILLALYGQYFKKPVIKSGFHMSLYVL